MDYAHTHLLLNHFPIIGTIFGFCILVVALLRDSDELKRTSLGALVVVALIAIPAYLSGTGAMNAIKHDPAVSQALIDKHEGAAMLAFLFMMITGTVALIGLWQFRGMSRPSRLNLPMVFVLSIITMGLMARTGNLGGDIRHTETQSAKNAAAGVESGLSKMIYAVEPSPDKVTSLMLTSKWLYAGIMTVHFIGLCLLMGTIGIMDARVLGLAKKIPIATLDKLIPWGIAGFGVNLVTGFMAYFGMPSYYTYDLVFVLKIGAIVLAGVNLLLFYVTDAFAECETVGPGGDAPILAKFIAGTSLILWIGVVVLGRYIQAFEATINH